MSRRRKTLIVAGIVFGVAVLVPVIHHYQLRFAVESYIAELKAKGEPMDLAQVIPPPVPPEQNGAPLIINSLTNFSYTDFSYTGIAWTNPPQAMHVILPGKAMVGWQQPDIRSSDGTNNWEDLGMELAAVKSDVASFRSLTNHPILDFNLNYGKGSTLPLPNLGPLRRAAQRLNVSALYNLHEGKPPDACADVRAMLAIVKGQTEER